MALQLRNWLLKQMNARDTLDGVAVTVKLAVTEFGTQRVAQELRTWAEYLEQTGTVPGWDFPASPIETVSRNHGGLTLRR